jgi:hypothetical protein
LATVRQPDKAANRPLTAARNAGKR